MLGTGPVNVLIFDWLFYCSFYFLYCFERKGMVTFIGSNYVFMLKRLFSTHSSQKTFTEKHLKKCVAFINYLIKKTELPLVITEGKEIRELEPGVDIKAFQPHLPADVLKQAVCCFIHSMETDLDRYMTALQTCRYFFIVDPKHSKIVNQLRNLNLTFFEGQLDRTPASPQILIGGNDINYQKTTRQVKVAALIHVFNEVDVLPETIRFLIEQGIHVHIIDNWSTDGSWEIAGSFPVMQVTKERFPPEGPTDHYEWYKQLEYSEQLAKQLPYDWFLHYDADELRYAPWKNVTLRNAISFIDSLGYNAIDFTVLDFRYTSDKEQVTTDFERNNTWFEFGKRPGHFLQVKGWKKNDQADLKTVGGHSISFPGINVYPVKFLNKHYSLRSKEQTRKKLVEHRLPRTQKEKNERGWHSHIELMIEQHSKGWDKKDLIEWKENTFQQHYLLERIAGIGIID